MAIRERELIEPVARRRPVRRVAKWLGIVLAVAVVLLAGWWLLAARGAVPPPSPITTAVAPAQPVEVGADGCLGGTDPHTAILTAHNTAPLDQYGAAGFARTLMRWGGNVPVDADAATVLGQVTSNPSYATQFLTAMTGYDRKVTAAGYTADGTVPGGADDVYRIVNADPAGASITVTVVEHRRSTLPDGSHTPELREIATVILDVVNGKWVAAGSQAQPDNPYAPITGVPWVQFVGAC